MLGAPEKRRQAGRTPCASRDSRTVIPREACGVHGACSALSRAGFIGAGLWLGSRPVFMGMTSFGRTLSRSRNKTAVMEPIEESVGPLAGCGFVGGTQAEAVPGIGIDVQFRGHAGPFEGQVDIGQALRNIGPIVIAAHQEDRRK